MHLAALVLLLGFAVLSAVDGLYIHLWRLRLHQRPASWMEHVWHSGRALLFVPILLTIFAAPTAGAMLWLGVALLAVDQVLEVLDVRAERASRADLGGVGRGELALHVVLIASRTLAVALSLAARPAQAWSWTAPAALGAHPALLHDLVTMLIPGAVAAAALHVALAWRHRPRSLACCRVSLA